VCASDRHTLAYTAYIPRFVANSTMSDGIEGPWSFRVVERLSAFFTPHPVLCYLCSMLLAISLSAVSLISLSLCCSLSVTAAYQLLSLIILSLCCSVAATNQTLSLSTLSLSLSLPAIRYQVSLSLTAILYIMQYQLIRQLISLISFLHSHTLFILSVISITLTAISLFISLSAL
jgi:hypothetical protein